MKKEKTAEIRGFQGCFDYSALLQCRGNRTHWQYSMVVTDYVVHCIAWEGSGAICFYLMYAPLLLLAIAHYFPPICTPQTRMKMYQFSKTNCKYTHQWHFMSILAIDLVNGPQEKTITEFFYCIATYLHFQLAAALQSSTTTSADYSLSGRLKRCSKIPEISKTCYQILNRSKQT